LGGKRLRVEILLTAADLLGSAEPVDASPFVSPPTPETSQIADDRVDLVAPVVDSARFDWHNLVDHDFWADVPPDMEEILSLVARSDVYVQDEVNLDLHPTLTRVWCRKGRRGQRRVRAPGVNRKLVGFGAMDWRNGWFGYGIGWHRNSEAMCEQLDYLVARSEKRGRKVILLWDNLGVHTRRGSKRLGECLDRLDDKIRLVYTPPYDPEANPAERIWRSMRPRVTHNHHRDRLIDFHQDAHDYFAILDAEPDKVLTQMGSPFASITQATRD
jgi:transposase